MKEGMSNVDVAAMAAELSSLLSGARLEKAYQPAKDQVLLRARGKGTGRLDLVFQLGRYLTVTRRPPDNPDKPSMVAQILRKELGNGRITGVHQIGFDRLLRMDIDRGSGRRALVFELFGDGNLLLLDGDTDEILLPMRGLEHGARRLKRGEIYQTPPGSALPFTQSLDDFVAQGKQGRKDVVRFLAVDVGFGPLWAEELCLRAGVDKGTNVGEATADHWAKLHAAVQALGEEIGRNDLAPLIIHDGETPIDAVPFAMLRYPADKFPAEEAATLREALDVFFRGAPGDDEDDDPRRPRYEAAYEKIERQVQQMADAISGFEADEAEARAHGEALFGAFQQVQATLDALTAAREKMPWTEVAGRIEAARQQGEEAAQIVVALRPHEGTATLRVPSLDGGFRDVEVDVRKNVQDNAEVHFAAAKKARSRQEGARKALEEAKGRLAAVEKKGVDGFGAAPAKKDETQRHFWFEHYRWTMTPGGFLVVGGRNAGQNDAVVKKYLRDGDRYVHADIHGAPSVVVRPADGGNAEPDDAELEVAGQFAACASRAWRQFAQASAYWVTPQQVSKTPRSGEFVPRGAWIVHGTRNRLDRLPMLWAAGLVRFTKGGLPMSPDADDPNAVNKLMGGPPAALAAWSRDVVAMTPGDTSSNDAALRLAERFDVTVEEAQAALPGGPVTLEGA